MPAVVSLRASVRKLSRHDGELTPVPASFTCYYDNFRTSVLSGGNVGCEDICSYLVHSAIVASSKLMQDVERFSIEWSNASSATSPHCARSCSFFLPHVHLTEGSLRLTGSYAHLKTEDTSAGRTNNHHPVPRFRRWDCRSSFEFQHFRSVV